MASAKQSTHTARKEPLRLLVLDDEPAIVRFLKALMQEEGFEVFEYTDPNQALIELEKVRPHLVLLDWLMSPGLGGSEFLRKLRGFDSEVPVIVVSGYAGGMTQEEKKCLEECRVSEIISKSLNMENARDLILQVVSERYPQHCSPRQ